MQVKTESCGAKQYTNDDDFPYTDPDDIAGYIIRRSPASRLLFNVFAVSSDDELLFCAASDLSAEKAMAFVQSLNEEYYPVVPTPTEGMFVDCCFTPTVTSIAGKV